MNPLKEKNTVLIVDDDMALCRSLQLQLKILGYEVITAFTAAEGLMRASSFSPALIFLDVHLPDENGFRILPVIRQENPESNIVIMTSDTSVNESMEKIRQNSVTFMAKPFELEDFLQHVSRHVGGANHRLDC